MNLNRLSPNPSHHGDPYMGQMRVQPVAARSWCRWCLARILLDVRDQAADYWHLPGAGGFDTCLAAAAPHGQHTPKETS